MRVEVRIKVKLDGDTVSNDKVVAAVNDLEDARKLRLQVIAAVQARGTSLIAEHAWRTGDTHFDGEATWVYFDGEWHDHIEQERPPTYTRNEQ